MTFWITITAIAVLATLWIASPFLRRRGIVMDDSEAAISVFRDQQDEVSRDLAEGLINAEEHDAAQREIQRRALKAAREMGSGFSLSQRSLPVAGVIVLVGTALGLAGYAWLGSPASEDRPLAARKMEVLEQRAAAGDINSRIALLIERTEENPEVFEDWWTLGAAYASTGDYASAVEAFRKAVELGGNRPNVLATYAEAMVLANGNKVPTAALVIFQQVLQSTPDPRARYYVALAKAQAQNFEGALADWTALAMESEPGAPWMPLVRRDIANMARFLNLDVTEYLPDASPAEVAKAGGAATGETLLARAAEIETSLAQDPMDYRGWVELAQIRVQGGDDAGAQSALAEARQRYAAAPFVLQKLDQAAETLGLNLLPPAPGVGGPTAQDMADAADMDEADRSSMIEGMVAGLAAKLEENPDNPEGWIMLVRSYAVLGDPEKARSSYETAVAHFDGNGEVLARLNTEALALVTDR